MASKTFDGKAMGEGIVALVRSFVERTLRASLSVRDVRLDAIEARLSGIEQRKSISYAGVWREGAQYSAGMLVTHSGCLWHCRERTTERPGTPSWQLMHKSLER